MTSPPVDSRDGYEDDDVSSGEDDDVSSAVEEGGDDVTSGGVRMKQNVIIYFFPVKVMTSQGVGIKGGVTSSVPPNCKNTSECIRIRRTENENVGDDDVSNGENVEPVRFYDYEDDDVTTENDDVASGGD
ncbi:hypothetical protein CTI12_AA243590 [Artemisia annua]|uniref:Uncharacterized protein n=1 Tax=Artemisia annua TaxID=35608 RepID=A0A2U1MXI7_ARTAN|nr:hypothetical protein CTI12_AA243590 [Artemisia annua]